MRPAAGISLLEGSISRGANLAAHARSALLGFAFTTIPGTGGYGNDAVACLMHGNGAVLAVTVDERVLRPPPLVRTNAASAHHFFHIVQLKLLNFD